MVKLVQNMTCDDGKPYSSVFGRGYLNTCFNTLDATTFDRPI